MSPGLSSLTRSSARRGDVPWLLMLSPILGLRRCIRVSRLLNVIDFCKCDREESCIIVRAKCHRVTVAFTELRSGHTDGYVSNNP